MEHCDLSLRRVAVGTKERLGAGALRQGERRRDDGSRCYDDDGGRAGEASGGSMRVEGSWGAEKEGVAGDGEADCERGDLRPGDNAAQRVERPL